MASVQLFTITRDGVEVLDYLLYCIIQEHEDLSSTVVNGVASEPVFTLSGDNLRAVVSKYAPEKGANLSGLLAYRDVIDFFHERHSVVPMRYGCIFPDQSRILSFLKERRNHFLKLLIELGGSVEMGIRVLNPGGESPPPAPQLKLTMTYSSGRSFLAHRKAHYDGMEKISMEKEAFTRQCTEAFSGLYRKWKADCLPMFSLYFLVPRGSVEEFRIVFREIEKTVSQHLLLSGPWPPYNFVSNDEL